MHESMKRFFFFAAFLVASASCQMTALMEDMDIVNDADAVVISEVSASYAAAPETKTIREADLSVSWLPGDAINLFYGGSSSRFVSTNEEVAPVATFAGSLNAVLGGSEEGEDIMFYGLYPYDETATVSNGKITTTVKASQVAEVNTFADDLFVSMACSPNTSLGFYNLLGGLKFSVKQAGVRQVVFKGRNNEVIAGRVETKFTADGYPVVNKVINGATEITVTAPDGGVLEPGKYYYIVMLPQTFASGFTMEFITSDKVGVYTRLLSTTINRSRFASLTSADKSVTYTTTNRDVMYNVSQALQNCSLESTEYTVAEGSAYYSEITLDEGYSRLSYVRITMGGVDCTADYYREGVDQEGNPTFAVDIPAVTGDVNISLVAATSDILYDVYYNLDGCTAQFASASVIAGHDYEFSITPDEGCGKCEINVTVGGVNRPLVSNEVQYVAATATVPAHYLVTLSNVQGDVVVNASAFYYTIESITASELTGMSIGQSKDVLLFCIGSKRGANATPYFLGSSNSGTSFWKFFESNAEDTTIFNRIFSNATDYIFDSATELLDSDWSYQTRLDYYVYTIEKLSDSSYRILHKRDSKYIKSSTVSTGLYTMDQNGADALFSVEQSDSMTNGVLFTDSGYYLNGESTNSYTVSRSQTISDSCIWYVYELSSSLLEEE